MRYLKRHRQPAVPKAKSRPPGKLHPPIEKPEELQQLFPAQGIEVAATYLPPGLLTMPLAAPSLADLQPTIDAPFTLDIQALAQQLDHNPVRIYNWVLENLEFIPSYGFLQGA